MAPRGHVHFHPRGDAYCDDFSTTHVLRQGLLIHELVHVWQVQTKGDWYLLTRRMPWARYDYSLKPGWPLERYGIEQQAEIVKHAFWLRNGVKVAGIADFRSIRPAGPLPGGRALGTAGSRCEKGRPMGDGPCSFGQMFIRPGDQRQ